MQSGWIKLHRKILDNEFLRKDKHAFIVFIRLLLLVDRNTGEWSGGRFQLSELTGLKPTTAYAATARLKKAKMMTLSSNNRFSTFSICKWKEYQGLDNSISDNKMTTRRQQDDTLTRRREVKKKRITTITTDVVVAKPQSELNDLIKFSKLLGFPLQGTIKGNRYSAYNLLKKFGLEKAQKLVKGAVQARGRPYSPTINDFTQLYRKVGDLVTFYSKDKPKGVSI